MQSFKAMFNNISITFAKALMVLLVLNERSIWKGNAV